MQSDAGAIVGPMRQTLLASVNTGGGWGYYPGHDSRLEPTCWAILALGKDASAAVGDTSRGFFREAARADGLLVEAAVRGEDRPNLAFNGLAAVLFQEQKDLAPAGSLDGLTAALIDHRGIKLPQSNLSPQDNSLQAWAWVDTTFSWVEPTCWCTLALKKVGGRSEAARRRIEVAEQLLRDRCCTAGGWNSGTAMVLGQGLNPYVPTTALGLIALQNLPQDPVVVRSLEQLRNLRLSERSGMALSLAVIAFGLFGLDSSELESALVQQWNRTGFLGNAHLTAMALYALTHTDHEMSAFRI